MNTRKMNEVKMNEQEMEKMILCQTKDSITSSVFNCMDRFDSLNRLYEDIFQTKSEDKSKVRFAGATVLGVTYVLNDLIDKAPVNKLGKKKLAEYLVDMFSKQLNEWCSLSTEVKDENIASIKICTFKRVNYWAVRSLWSSGIYTVGDLMKSNKEEISKIPHVGKKTVDALVVGLEKLGLMLPEKSTKENNDFEVDKA